MIPHATLENLSITLIPEDQRSRSDLRFLVRIQTENFLYEKEHTREDIGCFLDDLTTLFIVYGGCAEQDECK